MARRNLAIHDTLGHAQFFVFHDQDEVGDDVSFRVIFVHSQRTVRFRFSVFRLSNVS